MPKNEAVVSDGNIHEGHRQRMREKLELHGERVFATYELLEMLLYSVIPCQNTNPRAKNLIKRFSSVDGVFSADKAELLSVEGIGEKTAELILSVGNFASALMKNEAVPEAEVPVGYRELGNYLVRKLQPFIDEYSVSLVLFNSRLEKICMKKIYDVDFASAAVKPDAFVNPAVEHGAAAAVIVHVHPFGPLYPTLGDYETNKLIGEALATVGVELAEHYIISGSMYIGIMHHLDNAFFKNDQKLLMDSTEDDCLE